MAKIMVIDDEVEACRALEEYLVLKGHKVTMAQDGEPAVERIKKSKPDIVLLDIIMPGISGQETLRRIREIDSDIKVIMVTVVNNEEHVVKSFELGAYDYITKPLDFSHLEKILWSIPTNQF